ncbi:MAG: hypothetical protein MI799_07550, partial [Desulfobacterales bacterium]|nr:hypothetical protein [Desulfobacterales bacterium]
LKLYKKLLQVYVLSSLNRQSCNFWGQIRQFQGDCSALALELEKIGVQVHGIARFSNQAIPYE